MESTGCQDGLSPIETSASSASIAVENNGRKKRSAGALPRNGNAIKTGKRLRLAHPKLPPGSEYITNRSFAFRRQIEAVCSVPADPGAALHQALVVDAVVCHETRRQLLGRWLRLHSAELSIPERAALLDSIGKAADARNRALKELKLDRDRRQDVIELLYQQPIAQEAAQRDSTDADDTTIAQQTDAAESKCGGVE